MLSKIGKCCLPNLLKPDLWCNLGVLLFRYLMTICFISSFIRIIIVEVGPKPEIFLVQKTSLFKRQLHCWRSGISSSFLWVQLNVQTSSMNNRVQGLMKTCMVTAVVHNLIREDVFQQDLEIHSN